eukprot:g4397.t1
MLVSVIAAYDVEDAMADHQSMAIELHEAGRAGAALASFHAAARFAPDSSENWYNLGLALMDFRGRREDARVALERAVELDPDNTDAQDALDEIEPDPPTFSLKFKTVPLAEFEKDRSVYEEGRVPFVVRVNTTGQGSWPAFRDWSLESLAARYGASIVDFYPRAMINVSESPFLLPFATAAQRFAAEDPATPDVPKYIQFRMDENVWHGHGGAHAVREALHPPPPFTPDAAWAERCIPARTEAEWPLDNLFSHSRWRVVVVGNLGSGMFLHGDAFASAVWQAQVVGRKRWALCHPDSRLGVDVDAFAVRPSEQPRLFEPQVRCGYVEVGPGDVLLYPAGWLHQTISTSPLTMSVAHRLVDVRRWASMVSYWRYACEHPGPDVEKDYPGAAPLLSDTVCRSVGRCLRPWKEMFREDDGFMGGLGGLAEKSKEQVELEQQRLMAEADEYWEARRAREAREGVKGEDGGEGGEGGEEDGEEEEEDEEEEGYTGG